MAYYKEPNRLEVYLVYGNGPFELSFTSSSTAHTWYRYNEKAVKSERITSEQQGNVSFVRNAAPGYGYFVEETGSMTKLIWIINYQSYAFDVHQLSVAGNCSGFWLEGQPEVPRMTYMLPASGQPVELKRQFEVSFQTLLWNEASRQFSPLSVSRTIEGNPYSGLINSKDTLPLCDTEVTLKGDLFARHFGVEKSFTTGMYQATIVQLYTDTTLIMDDAPNLTAGESGGLSAPAEISFQAYANEPVAALYRWKIYRTDTPNGSESPLLNFTGESEIGRASCRERGYDRV